MKLLNAFHAFYKFLSYCKFAHNGYSGINYTSWDKKKVVPVHRGLEPLYLNIYAVDIRGSTKASISMNNLS